MTAGCRAARAVAEGGVGRGVGGCLPATEDPAAGGGGSSGGRAGKSGGNGSSAGGSDASGGSGVGGRALVA